LKQPSNSTERASEPREPKLDGRYIRYKLFLAPSGIHRWGVFAQQWIPPRQKVIEYTGQRISRRETKIRDARPLHYLFTLDNYWTIDGAVGGSGAEFINHSCNPNLRAWVFQGHILYMSSRWIEPGEELTVDYQFPRNVEKVICSCGEENCRGTINVKK